VRQSFGDDVDYAMLVKIVAASPESAKGKNARAPKFKLRHYRAFFSRRWSSISPVAIRAIMTALPITSAGRFSPLGASGHYLGPLIRHFM